jgi:hypothetical protein
MNFARFTLMVAALLASGVGVAAEVPDDLEATWTAVTTSRDPIDASIENTVRQMSAIKRPFARSKLKESTPACRRLRIFETADHQLGIQCDGGKAVIAPADGTTCAWTTPDGDDYKLSHRIDGTRIVQRFVGPKGSKTATYVVNGDRLQVEVRIHSKHLPEDVVYDLSYVS